MGLTWTILLAVIFNMTSADFFDLTDVVLKVTKTLKVLIGRRPLRHSRYYLYLLDFWNYTISGCVFLCGTNSTDPQVALVYFLPRVVLKVYIFPVCPYTPIAKSEGNYDFTKALNYKVSLYAPS